MSEYKIPLLPLTQDVETKAVLKQTIEANRCLTELKKQSGILQIVAGRSRQRNVGRLDYFYAKGN